MKIIVSGNHATVYVPHNADFSKAMKYVAGAKRNPQTGAWEIPADAVLACREIMQRIYGETDLACLENKVTVRVTFKTRVIAHRSQVTVFGKTVARAYGRDSNVTVGTDVAFVVGTPEPGGSKINWTTEVPSGSVVILTNVPEGMLSSEVPGGIEFEVIDSPPKLNILKDEKERLLERIKKIDEMISKLDKA